MNPSHAHRQPHPDLTRHPIQALHLIDLENLAGGSHANPAQVDDVLAAYKTAVPVGPIDHIVVGTGPTLAPVAAFAWPAARLTIGHGLDGADHALIDWVWDHDHFANRYTALYLGSGDGIFVGLTESLRRRGLPTTAVARHGSMSRSLQDSTFNSVILETPHALAA